MHHLRQHGLFPFVCLLLLAGLGMPWLHEISHALESSDAHDHAHGEHSEVHEAHDAAHDAQDSSAPSGIAHTDDTCATCEIIGSLTAVEAGPPPRLTSLHLSTPLASRAGVPVSSSANGFDARGPPALHL
ncbi:MAG: hypothetical protein AAF752_14750 [Bacteroidota bacterium]